MQAEQQVSLDREASPHPENILFEVGDCAVIASSQIYDVPVQPAQKKAKKQTRQWAAWTRQEEESFFTALRLVGKNFEKITSRVQSKNKDQVRYYYYRLVRRMNKLLGPELFLDAKNSKFTNAAMLRWWSLLEKYSCKASKLHLKPRTFKRFIEALEDQLKKDRKKHIRTRHFQGENCSTTSGSNQARASRFDTNAVNVALENLNIRKLTSGKRSSLRRNAKIGINRSNCKGDSSPVKIARQRRKKGTASTAAYKKWEKAAIAGVSLVADAAEHLERSAVEKVAEHVQDIQGQKDFDPVGKDGPSLASSSPNLFIENNIQTPMKLKLQLFPIDEGTRRALETDNHNPHLELTLSTRKKISSVLEHLNRKWGSSSIASGELMLFPYCVEKENTASCQKWTQDSVLSAADVYAMIGSPPVFRLRYGWFSNAKHGFAIVEEPLASFNIFGEHKKSTNDKEPFVDSIPPTDIVSATNIVPSFIGGRTEIVGCVIADSGKNHLESSEHSQTIPLQRREVGNGSIPRQVEYMDYLRIRNGNTLSAVEWADSLTNISVGDLLSEASHNMDAICVDPAPPSSSQCLQQVPFTCDSFDAAIAAHIRKNQGKTAFQPTLETHSSSIWEAEETCDGFSFNKNSVFYQKVERAPRDASPEASKHSAKDFLAPATAVEELPGVMKPMDADLANGDPMHVCRPGDNSIKDLRGLTDIYWPDSLGQLDLEVPSCRYQSEDQILSDSLGGLNRLIASSLDAFQNCAFFGLDKREPVSSIEARETASFSEHKVGSEV